MGVSIVVLIIISLILLNEFKPQSVGQAGSGGGPVPGEENVSVTPLNYTESYLISIKNYKQLEISNNNVSDSLIEGEQIRDLQTFIGEGELSALSDNVWNVAGKDYGYQQFLFFDSKDKRNSIVKYSESDNDVNSDFFYVKNDGQIARYKLEFIEAPDSRITDANGSLTSSGNHLPDFQDTKLTLFDQQYRVLSATRPTPEGIQLTLVKSAKSANLLVGEPKTYHINNKRYDVEVLAIFNNKAQLDINGEMIEPNFNALHTLSDGTKVIIDSVWLGEPGVALYLAVDKMVLRDDNVTLDHRSSHNLEVDNKIIDGAQVIMGGATIRETFILFFIEINMTASDDLFVPVDGQLSDSITLGGEDKRVLVNNFFDIKYGGLTSEPTHDLRLKTSSDRRYELVWYDGDNNTVEMPVAYAEAGFDLSLGEESWTQESRTDQRRLILDESVPIWKNDYVVVTGGNPENGTAKSYLLQYKGADRTTRTNPKIRFKNIGSGEILEYSVASDNPRATISLGEFSFIVENASATTADDFQVYVDLDTTRKETVIKTTVAGPITDTLLEGESKVYRLGNYEYILGPVFIDSDEAKFIINGELTPKLKVGDSYILLDSNMISVSTVLYQDFAGGVHSVGFNITENPFIEGYDHAGIGNERVPVVDSYGSRWSFDWDVETLASLEEQDHIVVLQTTPHKRDYDTVQPSDLMLYITALSEPIVSASLNGLTLLTPDDAIVEDQVFYGYTSRGAFVTFNKHMDSPDEFTLNYPENQRFPQVYILGGLESPPDCVADWVCSGYGSCQPENKSYCVSAADQNSCSEVYERNLSELSPQQCVYQQKFVGVLGDVNTSISDLIMIDSNNRVTFKEGNDTILEFDYNFSLGELKLNNLTIEKQSENDTYGFIIIKGLDLTSQGKKKTVYVDKLTDSFSVCIKDAEVASISEFSGQCDSDDEVLLMCPGTERQYSCELNATTSKYKVSGLNHSGIKEQEPFCRDNTCSNDESCSSCSQDCGSCPVENNVNSGGGSTGSSSSKSKKSGSTISSTEQQDNILINDEVEDKTTKEAAEENGPVVEETVTPRNSYSIVLLLLSLFILSIGAVIFFIYHNKKSPSPQKIRKKRKK